MDGGGSLLSGRWAGTRRTQRVTVAESGEQDRVAAAWERFVAGDDAVPGVRPSILLSWYRCRDVYKVSPDLEVAPEGREHVEHTLRQDGILTELGRAAGAAESELRQALINVTDGTGLVVGTWGPRSQRRHADEVGLAYGFVWSEQSCGTNGMGTALERPGLADVRGAEHWCRGFHGWFSYGIAIRDPVSHAALAAIDVSRWGEDPSSRAAQWLRRTAAALESELRAQAVRKGYRLAEAFEAARTDGDDVLLAVDEAGKVVAADAAARELLGVICPEPAIDPFARLSLDAPYLPPLIAEAVRRAEQNPDWKGSLQLSSSDGEAVPAELRPVRFGRELAGLLVVQASSPQGDPLLDTGCPQPQQPLPRRIAAFRGNRIVLLAPEEIRFAEADQHVVWLMTAQGRLRAATRGLDNVERELGTPTFLRVHRRFVVNLGRVRELEVGFKGALTLSTSSKEFEAIPVSRRHAPALRRALGL